MGHAIGARSPKSFMRSLKEVADIFGNFWEFLTDVDYARVETVPEALEYLAEHDASLAERSKWGLKLT